MARITRLWLICALVDVSFGNGRLAVAGELHEAIRLGDVNEVVEVIKRTQHIDESDFFLGSPLHVAAVEQNPEIVRMLVEAGADIDAPSEVNGKNALHLSAELGDVGLVALLVELGANVESRDLRGQTAMHLAARGEHVLAVSRLIDAGAEVDSQELGKGLTPLMIASFQGSVELVKLLIDAGADVNAVNAHGRTPFFFATTDEGYVNAGDGEVIRYLVESGADVSWQDEQGLTRLAAAKQNGSKASNEVVRILSNLGIHY